MGNESQQDDVRPIECVSISIELEEAIAVFAKKKSISQQILRPKPNPTANANGKKTGETASHSGLQFIYRVNVYRTREQKQFNIWKCSCTLHDAPKHAHVNQNASLFLSLSLSSLSILNSEWFQRHHMSMISESRLCAASRQVARQIKHPNHYCRHNFTHLIHRR